MDIAAVTGFDVSRETLEKLQAYVAMIEKWNPAINLVARSTLGQIWQRHIADSLQVAEFLTQDQRLWCDIGSGGGLPGLVVAILAHDLTPGLRVDMVEVDQRKSVFLRQVVRELGLTCRVHTSKIEDLPPMSAEVLSARALAPLSSLCAYAKQHLAEGGVAIFPKGAQFASELNEAQKHWSFSVEQVESKTDPQARLLVLREIEHV